MNRVPIDNLCVNANDYSLDVIYLINFVCQWDCCMQCTSDNFHFVFKHKHTHSEKSNRNFEKNSLSLLDFDRSPIRLNEYRLSISIIARMSHDSRLVEKQIARDIYASNSCNSKAIISWWINFKSDRLMFRAIRPTHNGDGRWDHFKW